METESLKCSIHGEYLGDVVDFLGEKIFQACPKCSEDRERKREASEKERKENDEKIRREEMQRKWIKGCGIPQRFIGKSFDNYIPESDSAKKKLDFCRGYAVNFPENQTKGTSLILCGTTGTGKTHLTCAIVREVIDTHHRPAVFTTVTQVIRKVKETYNRDSLSTEQEAIDVFARPALLVIDEIGVQFGTDTEKHILFEIINRRYEAMLPTILISNLSLEALKEFTGDRVIDRMKEGGGRVLTFNWKSKRSTT